MQHCQMYIHMEYKNVKSPTYTEERCLEGHQLTLLQYELCYDNHNFDTM